MIRLAEVEDAKVLCNLLEQLGYSSELDQIEEIVSHNSENSPSTIYVYELSEKVAGFISLIRYFYFPTTQNIVRVTALCVDEEYRDMGIGGKLLRFAESLATNFGDKVIEITCSLEREQTHQFYLKHGYSKHSYKFFKQLVV
jgi:GNAT superfamily N-acetyltransferase